MPQGLGRVLTVDDDAAILLLIERYLSKAGYEVTTAPNAADGLRALKGARPDLILTDVMMPEMDGYEFCAALQADPELSLVPVVFLTALSSEADRAAALAAGGVDFLAKPVKKEELLAVVGRHIGDRSRWDQLRTPTASRKTSDNWPRFVAWLRGRVKAPAEAWEKKAATGAPALYELAAELGISGTQAASLAAEFLGLEAIPHINPEHLALGVLPTAFCRAHRVVVLERQGRCWLVAVDPFNPELDELLRRWSGGETPKLAVTHPAGLSSLLRRPGARGADAGELEKVSIPEMAEHLLETAVAERASDIHVEPKDDRTLVRFRVDGDLRDVYAFKHETGVMLVSRFKAVAELDVAEHRKPQDGSMPATIGGRQFVVRLATSSTPAGESMVLRLLEPWAKPKGLEELGMTAKQVSQMLEFARRQHGLLLFAGPTGSGKTTTVYSLLKHIDCKTRSLLSIEDPVEYRIPDANQQQVDEKAGLTFEALLKSSLRQDPNILFLGEIRDAFSAKMAVDFSSTGHLTISTIHTTNATTAVFRLERVGITRGAMADCVLGVIAQKLVRRLCPQCKKVGPLTPEESSWLKVFSDDPPKEAARPAGCPKCSRTGFMGREGLYEIVKFYPEISEMIRRGEPISAIRDFSRQRGDYLIADHGIEKVRRLLCSPKDVYEQVLLEEAEYRRLAATTARAPAPAPPPACAPAASSGQAILLVDDDEDTRMLVQRILANRGYQVTLAADGAEALAQLGRGRFDLVISDVQMPNLDGLRLLELLANKGLDTPVIFFSGGADAAEESRGLSLGAEDYIRKPVAKDVLLLRVKRVLERRQKRR